MLNTRLSPAPLGSIGALLLALAVSLAACGKKEEKKAQPEQPAETPKTPEQPKAEGPDAAALQTQAKALFEGPLPERIEDPENPATEVKVALGRMLYYDTRLSKNHDISCNSCHSLTDYGIDVREPEDKRQVSLGHKASPGTRNSPTVYNAGLQYAQFWDAREPDLIAQAKGPVLNPVEMSMPDEASVVKILKSIPGYADAFKAAFPDDGDPITYDNMAKAIASFENGLMTPGPFDEFLAGKLDALSTDQLHGLKLFIEVGCTACHTGPNVGGKIPQKLGLMKPWESEDTGIHSVTGKDADKYMFKVPILRNITKTGPYLHDGSIASLEEMIRKMAEYQTARGELKDDEVKYLLAFMEALTGELPTEYIAEPTLPPSGPKTPKPDPS